jgi:hypothetical protein
MIKGVFQIESIYERGKVEVREVEFESVQELEQFLAYQRAYIKGVKFEGEIEYKEEEE